MRRLLTVIAVVSAMLVLGVTTASAGVTDLAFYVDGEVYRTVGTPAILPNTGAPDQSFDVIYDIAGQLNVAEAAPGDTDYNGGRWQLHAISFVDYEAAVALYDTNGSGDFDSVEELKDAFGDGAATDDGIVQTFECPVIPRPRNN